MSGATVSGSVTKGGIKFNYVEVKTSNAGGGPRGISIQPDGSPAGMVKYYPTNPNPHDNPAYNASGGQAKFYAALANFLTTGVTEERAETTFTPVEGRPPTIAGPAWTKLNKKQQDAATKEYNTKQKAAVDAANKKNFYNSLNKQLLAKSGNCTWEGVSYKIPKGAAG